MQQDGVVDVAGSKQEVATALEARALRRAALTRRVRRRALLDVALVGLLTGTAAAVGATTHEALLAASSALSLGILGYVIRRDRDLVALAAEARLREDAVRGRGITLAQWRSGAPLAAWSARREAAAEELA
jgi:hypothetical protein